MLFDGANENRSDEKLSAVVTEPDVHEMRQHDEIARPNNLERSEFGGYARYSNNT